MDNIQGERKAFQIFKVMESKIHRVLGQSLCMLKNTLIMGAILRLAHFFLLLF